MDPIKTKALELAVADGGHDAGAVARAAAYEEFLRGAPGDGQNAFKQSAEPEQAPSSAQGKGPARSAEMAIDRARDALTDALALPPGAIDHFPPVLRDFLDADMPEWLALAADREMRRQAGLVSSTEGHLRHSERWSRFVRSVAGQAGTTNGVRFPPDV